MTGVDPVLSQIASTGIVGAFCVLALIMFWAKDKALTKEMNSRIEDARQFTAFVIAIQKEVISAVNALTKIADTLEKREEERERLLHELEKQREEKQRLESALQMQQHASSAGFQPQDDPRRTGPRPPTITTPRRDP